MRYRHRQVDQGLLWVVSSVAHWHWVLNSLVTENATWWHLSQITFVLKVPIALSSTFGLASLFLSRLSILNCFLILMCFLFLLLFLLTLRSTFAMSKDTNIDPSIQPYDVWCTKSLTGKERELVLKAWNEYSVTKSVNLKLESSLINATTLIIYELFDKHGRW